MRMKRLWAESSCDSEVRITLNYAELQLVYSVFDLSLVWVMAILVGERKGQLYDGDQQKKKGSNRFLCLFC